MNETDNSGMEQSDEWKIAVITTQPVGPRYTLRLDSGTGEAVDNVEFNGFKLGLDGRAEVEYKKLEIEDGNFTSTAKFYDKSADTETDQ